jgi:hypothetical protein
LGGELAQAGVMHGLKVSLAAEPRTTESPSAVFDGTQAADRFACIEFSQPRVRAENPQAEGS